MSSPSSPTQTPTQTESPAEAPAPKVQQYFSAPSQDVRAQPWKDWYEKQSQQNGEKDFLTMTDEFVKRADHVAA